MRDALHDLPDASRLHTDFYDRDRVATWANEYPGIAAWVRSRIGRGLSGWSSIGEWSGTRVGEKAAYLFSDKACLTDERSRERERLTITEGIKTLRAALRTPKQCIRLIGLSGLGKTRLIQALFESEVGEEPLDPESRHLHRLFRRNRAHRARHGAPAGAQRSTRDPGRR